MFHQLSDGFQLIKLVFDNGDGIAMMTERCLRSIYVFVSFIPNAVLLRVTFAGMYFLVTVKCFCHI